jgi:methionyl-tRNA formyltransferase
LRAVVFGYHEIGYVCLEELLDFGVNVLCLFTHKDDPREEVWFRRPAHLAEERKIPVYTPESLKDSHWAELLESLAPDVIFSFYYRLIIPKRILETAAVGAFNLHGSLLPKFRGRCPVNWVLIEGEQETGLTLHIMEEKADRGDIVAQRAIPIAPEDTAYSLFLKMATEARLIMRQVLPQVRDGTFVRTAQEGPSSYFGGRTPEDGRIDWHREAQSIYNLVRATTHPYPGAFTSLGKKRLYIWKALPLSGAEDGLPGALSALEPLTVVCGKGRLELLSVQLEGEKEMDGHRFVRTHNLEGLILGGNL